MTPLDLLGYDCDSLVTVTVVLSSSINHQIAVATAVKIPVVTRYAVDFDIVVLLLLGL